MQQSMAEKALALVYQKHTQDVQNLAVVRDSNNYEAILTSIAPSQEPLKPHRDGRGFLFYPPFKGFEEKVDISQLGIKPEQLFDPVAGYKAIKSNMTQRAIFMYQMSSKRAPSMFVWGSGHGYKDCLQEPSQGEVHPAYVGDSFSKQPCQAQHTLKPAPKFSTDRTDKASVSILHDFRHGKVGYCTQCCLPDKQMCGAKAVWGVLEGDPDHVWTFRAYGQCIHGPDARPPYQHSSIRSLMEELTGVTLKGTKPSHYAQTLNAMVASHNPALIASSHPRAVVSLTAAQQESSKTSVTRLDPDPWRAGLMVDRVLRDKEAELGILDDNPDLRGIVRQGIFSNGCNDFHLYTYSQLLQYGLLVLQPRETQPGFYQDGTGGIVERKAGKPQDKIGAAQNKQIMLTTLAGDSLANEIHGIALSQRRGGMIVGHRLSDTNTKEDHAHFWTCLVNEAAYVHRKKPTEMKPSLLTLDGCMPQLDGAIVALNLMPGGSVEYCQYLHSKCLLYHHQANRLLGRLPPRAAAFITQYGHFLIDRQFTDCSEITGIAQKTLAGTCELVEHLTPEQQQERLKNLHPRVLAVYNEIFPRFLDAVQDLEFVERPEILSGKTFVRFCAWHDLMKYVHAAKYGGLFKSVPAEKRSLLSGSMVALFANPARNNMYRGPYKVVEADTHFLTIREFLMMATLPEESEIVCEDGRVFARIRSATATDVPHVSPEKQASLLDSVHQVLELTLSPDQYGHVPLIFIYKRSGSQCDTHTHAEAQQWDAEARARLGEADDGSDSEDDSSTACVVDHPDTAGCPAGHVVNPLYITARRGAATFLPLLEYFDKHVWPLRMLKLPLCDPLFEHAKPEIDRSEGEGSHHIVSHGTTALMEGNTADFKSDKDLWPLPKPIALFIEALYAYTGRKCVNFPIQVQAVLSKAQGRHSRSNGAFLNSLLKSARQVESDMKRMLQYLTEDSEGQVGNSGSQQGASQQDPGTQHPATPAAGVERTASNNKQKRTQRRQSTWGRKKDRKLSLKNIGKKQSMMAVGKPSASGRKGRRGVKKRTSAARQVVSVEWQGPCAEVKVEKKRTKRQYTCALQKNALQRQQNIGQHS